MIITITQHREGWWTVTIVNQNGEVVGHEDGLPSMDACLTYSHATVAESNMLAGRWA